MPKQKKIPVSASCHKKLHTNVSTDTSIDEIFFETEKGFDSNEVLRKQSSELDTSEEIKPENLKKNKKCQRLEKIAAAAAITETREAEPRKKLKTRKNYDQSSEITAVAAATALEKNYKLKPKTLRTAKAIASSLEDITDSKKCKIKSTKSDYNQWLEKVAAAAEIVREENKRRRPSKKKITKNKILGKKSVAQESTLPDLSRLSVDRQNFKAKATKATDEKWSEKAAAAVRRQISEIKITKGDVEKISISSMSSFSLGMKNSKNSETKKRMNRWRLKKVREKNNDDQKRKTKVSKLNENQNKIKAVASSSEDITDEGKTFNTKSIKRVYNHWFKKVTAAAVAQQKKEENLKSEPKVLKSTLLEDSHNLQTKTSKGNKEKLTEKATVAAAAVRRQKSEIKKTKSDENQSVEKTNLTSMSSLLLGMNRNKTKGIDIDSDRWSERAVEAEEGVREKNKKIQKCKIAALSSEDMIESKMIRQKEKRWPEKAAAAATAVEQKKCEDNLKSKIKPTKRKEIAAKLSEVSEEGNPRKPRKRAIKKNEEQDSEKAALTKEAAGSLTSLSSNVSKKIVAVAAVAALEEKRKYQKSKVRAHKVFDKSPKTLASSGDVDHCQTYERKIIKKDSYQKPEKVMAPLSSCLSEELIAISETNNEGPKMTSIQKKEDIDEIKRKRKMKRKGYAEVEVPGAQYDNSQRVKKKSKRRINYLNRYKKFGKPVAEVSEEITGKIVESQRFKTQTVEVPKIISRSKWNSAENQISECQLKKNWPSSDTVLSRQLQKLSHVFQSLDLNDRNAVDFQKCIADFGCDAFKQILRKELGKSKIKSLQCDKECVLRDVFNSEMEKYRKNLAAAKKAVKYENKDERKDKRKDKRKDRKHKRKDTRKDKKKDKRKDKMKHKRKDKRKDKSKYKRKDERKDKRKDKRLYKRIAKILAKRKVEWKDKRKTLYQTMLMGGDLTIEGPIEPYRNYVWTIIEYFLFLFAYFAMGACMVPMILYTFEAKHSWTINLHIFLVTIGYQFLVPLAIMGMSRFDFTANYHSHTERYKQGRIFRIIAFFFLVFSILVMMFERPWELMFAIIGNWHVIFGFYAFLLSFFEIKALMRGNKEDTYTGYVYALINALTFLCTSVAYGIALYRPTVSDWLPYNQMRFHLFMLCMIYTIIVISVPIRAFRGFIIKYAYKLMYSKEPYIG